MVLDEFNLQGRVAIVTGGTSGIGEAVALALAEAGADVVATSRTRSKVEKVSEKLRQAGAKTIEITTDVTRTQEIEGLKEQVLAEFGRIDILVNNAGMTIKKKAEELELAEWQRIIDLNLTSVFACSQIIGRQMIAQKSGKIINIASVGSSLAIRRSVAYCASKGGVEQLTKVLASEWVEYGIQVNAIAPGYITTPLTEGMLKDEGFMTRLRNRVPMKRTGRADELKGLAVYLASSASSYMTGEVVYVDGGWSILGV
ncbi:MAG: SDR family oxidoreductase [Halanaerobium sp.]|nr:SDR family oxidoreductase [Halanaerobium sp.]